MTQEDDDGAPVGMEAAPGHRKIEADAPRPRTAPLRWHLVALVLATLTPLTVLAGVLVLRAARAERTMMERRLQRAAEAMAGDVDRALRSSVLTLRALAESVYFDTGDFVGFDREAERVAQTQPHWLELLAWSPASQLVVDSTEPGVAPRKAVEPVSLEQAIRTREPVVGRLTHGTDTWAFPVRVPVVRDGELRCVLTAVIDSGAVAELVSTAPGGEEWTRVVVDGGGRVVARTRDPQTWVGKDATESFTRQTRATGSGLYADTTLDGVQAYVAFARVPSADWVVAVTTPRGFIDAPVRRSMLMSGGLAVLTLAVSVTAPWWLGRRVERAIGAAAHAARALAEGRPPRVPPSSVAEVAELGDALRRSGELLRQRAAERDEHLARALEATASLRRLNETLEQQVTQRTELAERRATQLRALASELAQAEQRERRRMAHILHEHFQQMLAAARMQLSARRDAAQRGGVSRQLQQTDEILAQTIDESRSLAVELSPPVLHREGLGEALHWLARSMKERHGLRVTVHADDAMPPLPEDTRLLLFHAARELLFNVVKHAGVDEATVALGLRGERVRLTVSDRGRGIDNVTGPAPGRAGGLGLFGLRERLHLLGGTLDFGARAAAAPSGRGATVTLELPLHLAGAPALA